MKILYRERDYAYGAAMLTLRNAIGLTQKGLAEHLGVSRRAVGEWEAGNSYPNVEHLKQLIVLAVSQQAFPVGDEAQEIRKLWKVAHQKVLLDERWLSALLAQPRFPECMERSEKQMPKMYAREVVIAADRGKPYSAYGQPLGGLCSEVEAEEQNDPVVIPIYPTDWGRFALGSPSGSVLYPGQWVEILLAGYRIAGTIYAGAMGDFFQSADGKSCCGLCAGMRVIVPQMKLE